MGMRNGTRREIRKLRELVNVLLRGKVCCFCDRPLVTDSTGFEGTSDGPKLVEQLSIHHRDGNHLNDDPSNHDLCHRQCHKRHHLSERHRMRRQVG